VNPDLCLAARGEEGCGSCERHCPTGAIDMVQAGDVRRPVVAEEQCIGCGKCEKTCPFGAIKVENNVAYIDFNLCRLCRKCVAECPTGAIHAVNFPPLPPKKEAPADGDPAPVKAPAPQTAPAQAV